MGRTYTVIKNSGKKSKLSFQIKAQQVVPFFFREKGSLITDNQKLANLFNTYFINVTDTLQLKKSPLKFQCLSEIISFYENHDSISKMKESNIIPKEFSFKEVSSNEIKKINR